MSHTSRMCRNCETRLVGAAGQKAVPGIRFRAMPNRRLERGLFPFQAPQSGLPRSLAPLRSTERDALLELGLSAEQRAAVQEVVRATNADSDLARSVAALVYYAGSVSAARSLVVRHPSLLCCQLHSWTEFLTAFGLNKAQVQHVLCQTPEALLQGDLVRAGESILAFRRLGLDERAASQLVTYYPQLLGKSEADIRATIQLLGRFQQGVESSSC